MTRVIGASLVGVDGVAVEVEVRLSSQLPRIDIVGLPEAAVRESAARVRAAIASVGQRFPDRRITVNLAPASLRKGNAGLDLPIALGILAAAGALESERLRALGLLGELALERCVVRQDPVAGYAQARRYRGGVKLRITSMGGVHTRMISAAQGFAQPRNFIQSLQSPPL